MYLWLIHVDVWQKLTQYYKAIILQLKINRQTKKGNFRGLPWWSSGYVSTLPLPLVQVPSLVRELRSCTPPGQKINEIEIFHQSPT